MWASIRSKLPSRNTSLVFGTLGGIISYQFYNKKQSARILNEFKEKASAIANETMQPLDEVRKVRVYISPSPGELSNSKGYSHWEKYILPVFVAGALDYELVLVSDKDSEGKPIPGSTHSRVCQDIVEARRKRLTSVNPILQDMVNENKRRKYVEEHDGQEPPQSNQNYSEEWNKSPWDQDKTADSEPLDVITIGRHCFAEAVSGISEGLNASLNDKPKKTVVDDAPLLSETEIIEAKDKDADSINSVGAAVVDENQDATDENAKKSDEVQSPNKTDENVAKEEEKSYLPQMFIDYDEYARHQPVSVRTPAIGYISHYNYTGWGSIPLRIWWFFNDQENTKFYGEQALKVVIDAKRPWRPEDKHAGIGEEQMNGWEGRHAEVVLAKNVEKDLQVYETQVLVESPDTPKDSSTSSN
ncbi:mitochondrial import inner membrane translocase subunit tim54 [Mycoemilia scoparia]|uniref:Mitochondrial import inner membrane translocase subunit TIM54 n=1 Tax=Mycoemilia scoparia TaxID=417184 RepID=A0A9W8A3E2_9FUNG|nr:mitochondrial import inner membrane translocase subunit tim54 [Mycoemilia scoparia]